MSFRVSIMRRMKLFSLRPEIIQVNYFIRPRVQVRSRDDQIIWISFHHDTYERPRTFSWEELKPGSIIAILYAERKFMRDFTIGIRKKCWIRLCFQSTTTNPDSRKNKGSSKEPCRLEMLFCSGAESKLQRCFIL